MPAVSFWYIRDQGDILEIELADFSSANSRADGSLVLDQNPPEINEAVWLGRNLYRVLQVRGSRVQLLQDTTGAIFEVNLKPEDPAPQPALRFDREVLSDVD